ncbi:MAG: serine/threonine-protein kinase, partial [Myxococcota bacterium]
VAAARGLLSAAVPSYLDTIDRGLSEGLTPTEWRRAAASLAARIAINPDETLTRAGQLLYSPVPERDPGVIAAMIFALPCAVDAEREAAEELLSLLIDAGDIFAIEALVDLRRERIGSDFGVDAALRARDQLRKGGNDADDGMIALKEALSDELTPPDRPDDRTGQPGLEDHLVGALRAFASGDAAAASAATDRALDTAGAAMLRLERSGNGDDSDQRRAAFRALRELDRGILETTVLSDLLVIRSQTDEVLAPLARLRERMTSWLLAHESKPLRSAHIEHPTWRLRRLRTLLHLVDADGGSGPVQADDPRLRERRARAMSALFTRVSHDIPSPLRRTVCAALARVCDAVVREELCELSDAFLTSTTNVTSDSDLAVLGEASMDPSLKSLIRGYVDVQRTVDTAREDPSAGNVVACMEAVRGLVQVVPSARSPRIEALRAALQSYNRSLLAVHTVRSLAELAQDSSSRLSGLESSIHWLARLVVGARRRLERGHHAPWPKSGGALRVLDAAVERATRGERKGLSNAVASAVQTIRTELPLALAELCAVILWRIPELPDTASESEDDGDRAVVDGKPRMVPWLPPSRILGGFYILRTIGKGAVGSVFVARRVEERHEESAEAFALKVPEYHGAAAHLLSEAEFHELFREEARALLALPRHPNLARFVTFDVGARPKPILVMELVRGPTLERVLDREEFSVAKALEILDGIAMGLEAMHSVGVAHLDVKPSNIILRDSENGETTPVLVDFGLAGRKIRPGCATVHYGAPEVWSPQTSSDLEPMPTDVYAFACLAFELLTNEILFDGETAVSIVSAHLAHGGIPELMVDLSGDHRFSDLMELLRMGLHPAADDRAPITKLRA